LILSAHSLLLSETMVKKISVDKLQLGMYVCGTDRKWLDLPFFRWKFLLNNEQQLANLRHYCQHVNIDTNKGCDEKPPADAMTVVDTMELDQKFNYATDFEVAELSSGELGLLRNSHAPEDLSPELLIMTDAGKHLLRQAVLAELDALEAQGVTISRLLESQDPLRELLMAVHARTKDLQATK